MDSQPEPTSIESSLNLSRHLAALSAAFIYSIIYIFLYYRGYTRFTSEQIFIVLSIFWAGNLLFTAIFISGLSKYFHDLSMSQIQLLWATIFALIAVYYLEGMRELILIFYFAMLSFGFFGFQTHQFITSGLLAIAGYMLVIMLLIIHQPTSIDFTTEILRFIAFTLTTIIIIYTGSSVSRLRAELRQKQHELEDAVELNMRLAITDDLTGLYTRRYFMDMLTQQKAVSERDGSDFVVCFADLDHFKYINDSFGHHTGDVVLQKFSEIIQSSIREIDYASRFGGEEFVILLVNTNIEKSLIVAERIRKSLEGYNFSDIAPGLNVSVSIGLANFRQYNSLQETLMSADNRMYTAKQQGRNKVVSS